MDGGAWQATSPWDRKLLDTTERLHFHFTIDTKFIFKNVWECFSLKGKKKQLLRKFFLKNLGSENNNSWDRNKYPSILHRIGYSLSQISVFQATEVCHLIKDFNQICSHFHLKSVCLRQMSLFHLKFSQLTYFLNAKGITSCYPGI